MIAIKITDNKAFGKCCEMCTPEPMPLNDKGRVDVEAVKSIIGCDLFDIVGIDHGIDMWVDDEGLYTKLGQYNWPATALRTLHWTKNSASIACPCNYPPICGTVVLLGVDDDGNTVDLTTEQTAYINKILLGL